MITTKCEVKQYVCLNSANTELIIIDAELLTLCNRDIAFLTEYKTECIDNSGTATTSAMVEMGEDLRAVVKDTIYLSWVFMMVVLLYVGWRFGIYIYRK